MIRINDPLVCQHKLLFNGPFRNAVFPSIGKLKKIVCSICAKDPDSSSEQRSNDSSKSLPSSGITTWLSRALLRITSLFFILFVFLNPLCLITFCKRFVNEFRTCSLSNCEVHLPLSFHAESAIASLMFFGSTILTESANIKHFRIGCSCRLGLLLVGWIFTILSLMGDLLSSVFRISRLIEGMPPFELPILRAETQQFTCTGVRRIGKFCLIIVVFLSMSVVAWVRIAITQGNKEFRSDASFEQPQRECGFVFRQRRSVQSKLRMRKHFDAIPCLSWRCLAIRQIGVDRSVSWMRNWYRDQIHVYGSINVLDRILSSKSQDLSLSGDESGGWIRLSLFVVHGIGKGRSEVVVGRFVEFLEGFAMRANSSAILSLEASAEILVEVNALDVGAYDYDVFGIVKALMLGYSSIVLLLHNRISGESLFAGTPGVSDLLSYEDCENDFRKAYHLVGFKYRKNRDRIVAYRLLQAIGGRSLEPVPLCCCAFDCQLWKLQLESSLMNYEVRRICRILSRIILEVHSVFSGSIPPKKSRGKGSQGKKSADPTEESIDMSDEPKPETLIRRKTSSRRVKKKATISVDDNIVPEPDIASDFRKILLAFKEDEGRSPAARQVHDTHARIGIRICPRNHAENEAWRMLGRQPGTGGSDEGTGEISRIKVRKNADTEMKAAEKTADITKETTEQPLTSSSFSVPSDYGNQFLNLSHNEEILSNIQFLQQNNTISYKQLQHNQSSPTAPAIIPEIPEITPFIVLQLRVAKLELDMSEVKKFDHSADVLAFIQSQVPLVVDKYLGTKLDDALLKTLERHTADLVEKYSMLPTPESSKKQESEKSQEEIIIIKREQEEKRQEPTYTIKSTDQAALEEFDLKSALFKSIHKNKSANRNPANYRLYHDLMEALIEDENAMDKKVADTGKSIKRRRTRESESAKKPSTTKDSSKDKDPKVGFKTSKSAPAKDPVEEPTDEVMVEEQYTEDIPISDEGHVSDSSSNCLPEADYTGQRQLLKPYQDQDENTDYNKIDDLGSFLRWYCRRTGKEELSKADLEGPTFMMIDLVNPKGHRFVPDISNPLPLGGTPGQSDPHLRIFSVISIKTYERYGYNYLREIVLRRADYNEYKISEKDFKSLHPNDFEDLNILHIQGKLDHLPKQDKVNLHNAVSLWTRNIVIRKRVEDLQLGIESYQTKLNLEQPNWDASDFPFKEDYTIVFKPRAVIYRDRDDNRKMMRIDEVHKFSDGTLTRIKEKLDFMVKDFKLFKFNKGMENRKWTEDDKRRSEDFIEVIERRLKIRRIFRSLESFVGGRLRDIDYRLISRTE
ncbi:hypothetical protein Tco_0110618 [Tanacetum coccineum]